MYEKDPYYFKCDDEKSNLLDHYMLIFYLTFNTVANPFKQLSVKI